MIIFDFPDMNELTLPQTCKLDFPDKDDLLNFKLIICPDEVSISLFFLMILYEIIKVDKLKKSPLIFIVVY